MKITVVKNNLILRMTGWHFQLEDRVHIPMGQSMIIGLHVSLLRAASQYNDILTPFPSIMLVNR